MSFDIDYDVKEYKPKKKKKNNQPSISRDGWSDGAVQIDPGTVLTTSEIIDFSEGSDSAQ